MGRREVLGVALDQQVLPCERWPLDLLTGLSVLCSQQGLDEGWLLATADDGVLWGRMVQGQWETAPGACGVPPVLIRPSTLQELRVFNPTVEIRIWRGENGFEGTASRDRTVSAQRDDNPFAIEEEWVLRGAREGPPLAPGVVCLRDVAGSWQAIPGEDGKATRYVLQVRKYFEASGTRWQPRGIRWLALKSLRSNEG